jgi:hypothetical protein
MIKAALVNKETELVENIIIVDTLEDVVPDGYVLVEIYIQQVIEYTAEDNALYDILEEIDEDFTRPAKLTIEYPVVIGQTKWNINDGFYE